MQFQRMFADMKDDFINNIVRIEKYTLPLSSVVVTVGTSVKISDLFSESSLRV